MMGDFDVSARFIPAVNELVAVAAEGIFVVEFVRDFVKVSMILSGLGATVWLNAVNAKFTMKSNATRITTHGAYPI
jgi:uncharacterized protein (DUF697 family)